MLLYGARVIGVADSVGMRGACGEREPCALQACSHPSRQLLELTQYGYPIAGPIRAEYKSPARQPKC